MKEDLYDDLIEEKEEKTDYREVFFKYLIRWPWFVASVVVCLSIASLYLRYTTPVYNISASIIIKDEKKGGNIGGMSALEDFGLISSSKNIDNEIEIIRSKSLIKDVVTELNLNISYWRKDNIRSIETYPLSPIQVSLEPQEAAKLKSPLEIELSMLPGGKVDVQTTIAEKPYTAHFDQLPATLPTSAGTLHFSQGNDSTPVTEPVLLTVTVAPPLQTAKAYTRALSVEPSSKTTSIALISFKNTNKQRGEDFINKLIDVYNRDANDDKNEVAEKTAQFINDRILLINQELGHTEQELETFKRNAGLTDLSSDAQLTLVTSSEYDKRQVENETQINLIDYLNEYLTTNKEAVNAVLPANVGLTNTSLSAMINEYNERVLERNRLLRNSSESNPAIRRLQDILIDMKASLRTTLNSVRKGLLITKSDLEQQSNRFNRRISNAPLQERQLVSISRQQEIKAGLYLMLLQKREENAITLAATTNNSKIIDDALADEAPISPKNKMIYLIALLFGISLPAAAIYLVALFQYKIEGRADVEKLTTVPIVGNVPIATKLEGSIAVRENQNDLMNEIFRSIRTNLQFILGEDKKVIMVTSTISGEGKTFVASNLAISFALLGKRVVIMGLDIRKPGLNKAFSLSHKEAGITQYLAHPRTTDLFSLLQPSDITPNLSLLPGGVVPPNPTELLAMDALVDAIELLKQRFDYVILDTAPVGMVTDTFLIGRVADISVYICRADYTQKMDYKLIEELHKGNKLPHLYTIINGLDMKKKRYGYGYGYGRYYGYGYGKNKD